MKRRWLILILLSGCCAAQSLNRDKDFWVLTGTYTAGVLADNFSTQRYLKLGCIEKTNPWLYGKRPSESRFLSVSFSLESAELATTWTARKIFHRRMVMVMVPAAWEAANRWRAVAHNLSLTRQECQ